MKEVGEDRLECCKDGPEDGEAEAPESVVVVAVCAMVLKLSPENEFDKLKRTRSPPQPQQVIKLPIAYECSARVG